MKTIEQIKREALLTNDPAVLFSLVMDALNVAEFNAASKALAVKREKDAQEQIKRCTAMIDNLEKTLWAKKK